MSRNEPIPADISERLGVPERNGHTVETFTAADLMALTLPPPRFAIPGVVPEGVNILAARPKLGKSWLVLGWCVAITSGGVAFGKIPVDRGEVLYLALEDNKRRLQSRLRKLLAGAAVPDGLHLSTNWPKLDKGGLELLADWLADHPVTRLVIIDTLAKIRPDQAGRNVYAEDYGALEGLLPLAAQHGVAVVVVHHVRKAMAADPMDEISGSLGLSGGVDGMLVLKRDRGKADAVLHIDGRDIERPAELALKWDAETAGWTLIGDAGDFRVSQERQDIIAVLDGAESPMTPTEVSAVLEKKANAVKYLMWRMSQDGQISSVGNGRYAITANPTNSLTDEGQGGYQDGQQPLTGVLDESTIGKPITDTVSRVSKVSGYAGEETFE